MSNVDNISPVFHNVMQGWDKIKKYDEQTHADSILGSAFAESMKRSTRYRIQSKIIESGTEAVLSKSEIPEIIQKPFAKFQKLDEFAKMASSNTSAVTYFDLIKHLKDGGSYSTFNWGGLAKSRLWNQVDHTTCIADGTASSIGRFVATNLAKTFIFINAYNKGKIAYLNSQQYGDSNLKSIYEASKAAGKELGKSIISWEASSIGAAVMMVFFPALGFVGGMIGGILMGGISHFALDNLIPSPVEVKIKNDNPCQ